MTGSFNEKSVEPLAFTVDAALMRELGERLVGQPHIALAELVKNSFDADAHAVRIEFTGDSIRISDNGHGMTFDEFRDFWMRLGTPHKQDLRTSRRLGRALTGSKGVGRLSAQFLGRTLTVRTVSASTESELSATVDWDEVASARELTEASIDVTIDEEVMGKYPTGSAFGDPSGVELTISSLRETWSAADFRSLAREVWWLRPPFRTSVGDGSLGFDIEFDAPEHRDAVAEFEQQMSAFLSIWHARILGRLVPEEQGSGVVELTLEFADGELTTIRLPLPAPPGVDPQHSDVLADEDQPGSAGPNDDRSAERAPTSPQKIQDADPLEHLALGELSFEVRIYHLRYRQPSGIAVDDAREYLAEFGGVHVYDAGFHLPYYGAEHDWLDIERSHSHRLSRSKLLPEELQIAGGLTKLPTQSRILGEVHVNTAREARGTLSGDPLTIQVSRDRLVDNFAYRQLKAVVRYSLDWYAMRESARSLSIARTSSPQDAVSAVQRLMDLIEDVQAMMPESEVASALTEAAEKAVRHVREQERARESAVALLGSLATVGMSALAMEHEVQKAYSALERLAQRLATSGAQNDQLHVAQQIRASVQRARDIRKLLSPVMDSEDREVKSRFRARPVIERIVQDLGLILRGVEVEIDVEPELRLPEARYLEWAAIFQNVLANATNAMLDCTDRRLRIGSVRQKRKLKLVVQDTGIGVDLDDAEQLFQPFERRVVVSPQRRELGAGGSGLGLAIVQMIADEVGAEVGFEQADDGWSTQFFVAWRAG